MDAAHETLSGPATQKILQRAYYEFQEQGYERMARLSVALCERVAPLSVEVLVTPVEL